MENQPRFEVTIVGRDGSRRQPKSEDFGAELQRGERVVFTPIAQERPVEGETTEDTSLLLRFASFFGMAVSDFIESATGALGIPPCPVCQMRKLVLHRIKELGVMRATLLLVMSLKSTFGDAEAARMQKEIEGVGKK